MQILHFCLFYLVVRGRTLSGTGGRKINEDVEERRKNLDLGTKSGSFLEKFAELDSKRFSCLKNLLNKAQNAFFFRKLC